MTPTPKTKKVGKTLKELDKDKRIKKELNKFKKFIKDLIQVDKNMAMNLISELAFMKVTLEDLKLEINKNGVVTEMPQGDYSILRENPALKSYNTMIQRYNSALRQLDDFINKVAPKENEEADLLGQFLQRK